MRYTNGSNVKIVMSGSYNGVKYKYGDLAVLIRRINNNIWKAKFDRFEILLSELEFKPFYDKVIEMDIKFAQDRLSEMYGQKVKIIGGQDGSKDD